MLKSQEFEVNQFQELQPACAETGMSYEDRVAKPEQDVGDDGMQKIETKIADLAPQISAAEGELNTEMKMRAKENADEHAIEKELKT